MFPTMRVSFVGQLDSSSRYAVVMDVTPVDARRYRYAYHRSAWLVAGKADPAAPSRLYVHPDSPFTVPRTGDPTGGLAAVSFERLKLTNNTMDTGGRVSQRRQQYGARYTKYLTTVLRSCYDRG